MATVPSDWNRVYVLEEESKHRKANWFLWALKSVQNSVSGEVGVCEQRNLYNNSGEDDEDLKKWDDYRKAKNKEWQEEVWCRSQGDKDISIC
jgi:hypothetical protein